MLDNISQEQAYFEIQKFITLDGMQNNGAKVLFFHHSHDKDKDCGLNQNGLIDAFVENGFKVCAFNFNNCFKCLGHTKTQQALILLAKKIQPDWIHMQLGFFDEYVSSDTIKEIRNNVCPKTYITNYAGDVRNNAWPYFLEIGNIVDRSLIVSEGQLEMYRQAGCKNIDYWQVGYDPKCFFRKSNEDRAVLCSQLNHDIAFCANNINWYNFPGKLLREEVVSKLSHTFRQRFGLYGRNWNLPTVDSSSIRKFVRYYKQLDIYNGSLISINVNNYNNLRKYFSDRLLICLASGSLVVSVYTPGMEEYFENGKDLMWFNTADECLDLCKYYWKNPNLTNKIGIVGALKAQNEHTYYHRVNELSKRLGFK